MWLRALSIVGKPGSNHMAATTTVLMAPVKGKCYCRVIVGGEKVPCTRRGGPAHNSAWTAFNREKLQATKGLRWQWSGTRNKTLGENGCVSIGACVSKQTARGNVQLNREELCVRGGRGDIKPSANWQFARPFETLGVLKK